MHQILWLQLELEETRLELGEWNENLLELGESFPSMDGVMAPPAADASPVEESAPEAAAPHVRSMRQHPCSWRARCPTWLQLRLL